MQLFLSIFILSTVYFFLTFSYACIFHELFLCTWETASHISSKSMDSMLIVNVKCFILESKLPLALHPIHKLDYKKY